MNICDTVISDDLFAHFDNDVRVAAIDVTDGEVDASFDADSKESQEIVH